MSYVRVCSMVNALFNKEILLKKHIVIAQTILLFLFVQLLWPQEKRSIDTASTDITTIIIVRHAEKDTMKTDPPLTQRGRERAKLLTQILRSSGIAAIYSTPYNRTQQTVQPIAESLHLNPYTIDNPATLIRTILREQAGKVVLIASHSNVIPVLLREIGIEGEITIGDYEYDNLFIVTILADGKAHLLRLRYG